MGSPKALAFCRGPCSDLWPALASHRATEVRGLWRLNAKGRSFYPLGEGKPEVQKNTK
jgi:hypothetical protein